MKLLALQQSHASRRSNSFGGGRSPLAPTPLDSSSESSKASAISLFWLILHGLCCLISLVLGFRFSRLIFFLLFSTSPYMTPFQASKTTAILPSNLESPLNRTAATVTATSSRVVVGRHGIRIRPWPHPNPVEVMKAHRIIDIVQREQRNQFGVKNPRKVIAITPTYVRTFQMLHMTGVMHSLMLVPYDVVWIVVEAGGVTNETAALVAKSGLRFIHVGFNRKMPNSWAGRHHLEVQMRVRGLRIVREEKLDGIVVFTDDSNMHSMELFDEIQNVKWIGTVSVGILAHSTNADPHMVQDDSEKPSIPVQGPACNSSDKLVGWHTFNSTQYEGRNAVYIDDRAVVLPRKLEWSGFVLNSRMLWKEADDKPEWVLDLDSVEEIDTPLSLLKDPSVVEPLGSCGRQVLIWWLRVEARTDSKFPSGWVINPPLEVTVPSKRTPWPDIPPELPSVEKVTALETATQERPKRPPKTRSSRRRSSRKRKHDIRTGDTQVSTRRHSERN